MQWCQCIYFKLTPDLLEAFGCIRVGKALVLCKEMGDMCNIHRKG
jgi:hypothetical protein